MHLRFPPAALPERLYVWKEILKTRLGLDFTWEVDHRARETHLSLSGSGKQEIVIPEKFFSVWEELISSVPQSVGIGPDGVVDRCLPIMDPGEPIEWDTDEGRLPLIFYDGRQSEVLKDPGRIVLPFDLAGAIFFFLSRIEELSGPFDCHGRFAGKNSWAAHHDLLQRPLVDDYEKVLIRSIKSLWPGFSFKDHVFKVHPTHDVDWPFLSWNLPIKGVVKSSIKDVIKSWDFNLSLSRLKSRFLKHPEDDPAYTYDFLMDMSESQGLRSTFFFLTGGVDKQYESDYRIEQPEIRKILCRILDRGHDVGIHGSYHSLEIPGRLKFEADILRGAISSLGYEPSQIGGRQHFLRGSPPVLWRESEKAGLAFDSTMGFADISGFRAGTSREYQPFDIFNRKELSLKVRPLIVMDRSLCNPEGVCLDEGRAISRFIELSRKCAQTGGEFLFLWHNTTLLRKKDRERYTALIKAVNELN